MDAKSYVVVQSAQVTGMYFNGRLIRTWSTREVGAEEVLKDVMYLGQPTSVRFEGIPDLEDGEAMPYRLKDISEIENKGHF